MKIFKKVCCMLLVAMSVLVGANIVRAETYLTYTDPGIVTKISEKPVPVIIKFPTGVSKLVNIVYANGRMCVPLVTALENMGGTYDTSDAGKFKITIGTKTTWVNIAPSDTNIPTVVYVNGTAYISLYSLLTPFDYTPVFNVSKNSVTIYKKNCSMTGSEIEPNAGGTAAYIRFEDIMADGLDGNIGYYTTDRLEKLMYMADYMEKRNQKFYVAWIPLYSNPATNYTNNVSLDYNLYNSCFIYTLDYLTNHGGKIVLHGYTHQYGSDRSSVGWEWGSKTPFSSQQQQQRMINAKIIAARLGYDNNIFEFPHYGATTAQLKMAENYFTGIYQAYPRSDVQNILTYTTSSNGHRVYYIPTPADYVYNTGGAADALQRLRNSAAKKQAVSIFYHPTLDIKEKDYMAINRDETNMKLDWYFSAESVLAKLVSGVKDMGYSFTYYE
jgi:hypothetical protein